jgi:hypothetical protein
MRYITFITAILFFGFTAQCQTLEEILQKHQLSIGGTAWDSIQTAQMDIDWYAQSLPALVIPVRYTIQMQKAFRWDSSEPILSENLTDSSAISLMIKQMIAQKTKSSVCSFGDKGWSVLVSEGIEQRDTLSIEDLRALKQMSDLSGPLYRPEQKGNTVVLLEQEVVKGQMAFKIEVRNEHGFHAISYIDTSTYLEVKRKTFDGPKKYITYYSDFRSVNGVKLPFMVELYNDKGTSFFKYKEVKLNLKLRKDAFVWKG